MASIIETPEDVIRRTIATAVLAAITDPVSGPTFIDEARYAVKAADALMAALEERRKAPAPT